MGKLKTTLHTNNQFVPSDILLLISFVALILLHIVGGVWPSTYNWGVSYWSVLPEFGINLLSFFSLSLLLLVYLFKIKINFTFLKDKTYTLSPFDYVLYSALMFCLLYLFRSVAHVYGDGYTILEFVSTEDNIVISDQYNLQLLAVYMHHYIYKLMMTFGSFNREVIFAVTNIIGGVIGLWSIFHLAKILSRTVVEHLFLLIISLSSVAIILFFGYIESYTWAMSFMMWALYYNIKYLKKRCNSLPLISYTLLALAFHLITLPILIVTSIVLLCRIDKVKSTFDKLNFLIISLFVVLISFLFIAYTQSKDITIFVSLLETADNHYSFLSSYHLLDVMNLVLLIAPLGITFVLLSLPLFKNNKSKIDSIEKILYLLTLFTFLSVLFIDPLLGMVRDWDLFSFFGIPLTLLGGYRVVRLYTENKFPHWIVVASALVMLVHIVPNLYEKNNLQIAVNYLDKILWEDSHYQENYRGANRCNSWAFILKNCAKRNDLSEKFFLRHAEASHEDSEVCYNLGVKYFNEGDFTKARGYLQKGILANPNDPRFLAVLSSIEYQNLNNSLAEMYLRESLKIDSNYITALISLAIILTEKDQIEEAISCFKRVHLLQPDEFDNIKNLGIAFSIGENYDSAYYYLNHALPLAPNNDKIQILGSLISISLSLDFKGDAINYINQLKSLAPNSALLKEKEIELYGD